MRPSKPFPRFENPRFRDRLLGVRTDGTIQLVNQMAEKMFGYKREELVEQPIEMLLPEAFRPRHRGHREGYFENAQSRPMGTGLDLAGRRRDGTTFPVEIGLSVAQATTGKLAVAFVSDITERKRLDDAVRQREKELKTLLDNVPDGIVRFDRDMRYQYVSTVVKDRLTCRRYTLDPQGMSLSALTL